MTVPLYSYDQAFQGFVQERRVLKLERDGLAKIVRHPKGRIARAATRRVPYNDFGIFIIQDVVLGVGQQTVNTASYGANRLGFDVGEFVHINLGKADEEYVQVLAADQNAQTFDAIFTKNHSIGATVRPTIWPTPILNEGDSLAFDILAVANPDPGSDLTVVIQT